MRVVRRFPACAAAAVCGGVRREGRGAGRRPALHRTLPLHTLRALTVHRPALDQAAALFVFLSLPHSKEVSVRDFALRSRCRVCPTPNAVLGFLLSFVWARPSRPRASCSRLSAAARAAASLRESEQQHVVILVRNEGPPLDKHNMW